MRLFNGSAVALITPFTSENQVNYSKLGELIEWHLTQKTDALVVCGTTGEASTLTDQEHIEVIRYTVQKTKGRRPVIAGTGSNDTDYAVHLSKAAEEAGADALLCVTPYYNKATQKGLIRHFTTVAEAINIPMILYSVPGRTGVNIQPNTVAELAMHPRIQGIKEASGDIAQVLEIARLVPENFKIYSGNDDMILPVLSLGGHGVISVLANVLPNETHDMVQHYLDGNFSAALKLQKDTKLLTDALFCEVNPIPVKTALNLMGKAVGPLRAPLYEMEPENLERLKLALKDWHLLQEDAL